MGIRPARQILELAIEGKLKIGVSRALHDGAFRSDLSQIQNTHARKETTVRDVAYVSPFLTFIRRTSPPHWYVKIRRTMKFWCARWFKADCLISGDADIRVWGAFRVFRS